MKRLFFLITIAFAVIISLHAQLITWSVKPGVYSKIEPCWKDMYFVYKGNSIGVINGDGTIIVSPEASRVTGFYESYALVLKSEGGREKILGILSVDGTCAQVNGNFYTIPNQEFFSEGFVTVTNPQGRAAYMNSNGQVEKQFDVTFVTPFTEEGYATIGEGKEFKIIDNRFNPLQITIPSNLPIYGGTSVYKGQAIVWDGEGNPFSFNVTNGMSNRYNDKNIKKAIKNQQIEWDYLGCFSSITKRPAVVSYEQPSRSSETLSTTEKGGKYGYVKNEKTILPYQFEQAENFHGNYAIVKSNGNQALLVLRNVDESFGANATPSEIEYEKDVARDLVHKFGLSVPSLWNIEKISAKIKDTNGTFIPTSNKGGIFEFKSDGGEDKEAKQFDIELESEGLKLWNGEITYNYKVKTKPIPKPDSVFKPFEVSLKAKNTQADKNNRCYVEATITNPNSEAITATVTIKGSNLLEVVSPQRITVPAYGTKDISFYFSVKKAVSGQTVTVSTTAGGTATLDGLQLIPF